MSILGSEFLEQPLMYLIFMYIIDCLNLRLFMSPFVEVHPSFHVEHLGFLLRGELVIPKPVTVSAYVKPVGVGTWSKLTSLTGIAPSLDDFLVDDRG